jgi:hypothetical protein
MNVLQPHPEDRLHLRLHRARSVILTAQEFVLPVLFLFRFPGVLVRRLQRTNTWWQSLLFSPSPNAESLLFKLCEAWRLSFVAVSRADSASAFPRKF